jgi:hypothetical protein
MAPSGGQEMDETHRHTDAAAAAFDAGMQKDVSG